MGSSESAHLVRLFEPLELREVTAPNRIVISPMCQYCAPDAVPNDWHLVHLASRAVGGAGIVMTEATAVEPVGRITPFDLGLWDEQQETGFSRIASFVNAQGSVPGIQLSHAGRKASHSRPWEDRRPLTPEEGGWEVVGPSPFLGIPVILLPGSSLPKILLVWWKNSRPLQNEPCERVSVS